MDLLLALASPLSTSVRMKSNSKVSCATFRIHIMVVKTMCRQIKATLQQPGLTKENIILELLHSSTINNKFLIARRECKLSFQVLPKTNLFIIRKMQVHQFQWDQSLKSLFPSLIKYYFQRSSSSRQKLKGQNLSYNKLMLIGNLH